MDRNSLVIFERGRRWIDSVRARFAGADVRVRHVALAADCRDAVAAGRRSVVIIELGTRVIESLALVADARRIDSSAVVVVLAASSQGEFELPARELGAIAFVVEPITPREFAELVARVCRSHRQRDLK